MSDKDFKVKNKLQVKGITSAGPITSDSTGNIDSVPYIATQYGGTGTTTSPSSGQVLYSSSGTTYAPTALNTLDVKGATYSSSAPSNPVVGQVWVDSTSATSSFDSNIIRRKSFTATAGQTVFTTDFVFVNGYEQVYFNGMLLLRNSDYTTNGAAYTVTLTSAAALNDVVEVVTITNLNSINTATTTTNTFTGDQAIQGSLNLTGNSTNKVNISSKFTVDTSNSWGSISLARQSNSALDIMKIQGTDSTGTANALRFSNISGNAAAIDIFHDSLRFYVNSDTTERMRIDASGNVGINTTSVSPAVQKLDVQGNINMNTLTTTAGRKGSYSIGVGDAGIVGQKAAITFTGESTSTYGVLTNISFSNFNGDFYNSGLIERLKIDFTGNTQVMSGSKLILNNPVNTGSGSVYCPGGGSLTLAAYNQVGINLYEDSEIQFKTASGTDRMRVTSAGLLIGYTSSQGAYRLQVNSQIFATSSSIATSDGRYKENVNTIMGGLDIIDSLRPVSFTWKEHPVHNFVAGKTVGFIAQEVKESLSEYDWVDNIIKTNISDAILDEEGNEVTPAEEFLGIAESNIIPLLVAAVKELKARVETLEAN